jgi:hypothetical protein
VTEHRGHDLQDTGWAEHVLVTTHPSSVLRIPEPARRKEAQGLLAHDLEVAAQLMSG